MQMMELESEENLLMFNYFGENLSKCTKLRNLLVINTGPIGEETNFEPYMCT